MAYLLKNTFILFYLFLGVILYAQDVKKQTQVFAKHDSIDLKMDIYQIKTDSIQPCMIFLFGGGFIKGTRDNEVYQPYLQALSKSGITVISIDYRLGVQPKELKISNFIKTFDHAIHWAVEDLFLATKYVLNNAQTLKIDPDNIMISGTSAGAVTVLQAEYINQNKSELSEILPKNFNYSGIISFSGAIFSRSGFPKYANPPAPTLFFHGKEDKIVPYKKLRFFRLGLFGSQSLAKKYKKKHYPYYLYTIADKPHIACNASAMKDNISDVLWFIKEYVFKKKNLQLETFFKDLNISKDMYKSEKTISKY